MSNKQETSKKDYRINFWSSPYNSTHFACKVTFNRPDKVSLREVIEALTKMDQTKLYKAFANNNVSVIAAKGYCFGNINQATYEKGKRILENILKKEGVE